MTESAHQVFNDASATLGQIYLEIENRLDLSGVLDETSALAALAVRVTEDDSRRRSTSDARQEGQTVTEADSMPPGGTSDVTFDAQPRADTRGSAADRRAERRERLLDAGLELFGTAGYAAASIEKLCTHAGVSTRNFYEEFASREDLLMTLHDQIIEQAFQAVLGALSEGKDAPLRERFEMAVRAFLMTTASDPRWARVSYVEIIGVSNTVEKHRIAWRERWIAFMVAEGGRAVTRGEAVARDFTLGAVALIGSVNELVHHWSISAGQNSLDAVVTEIVRVAIAALTAP